MSFFNVVRPIAIPLVKPTVEPYGKSIGLLDQYGDAAVAYCLRARTSGWAFRPVLTVRRSSDDAEDSFTANEIANGSLESFCGVGDGFVKVLYDQSGNGRDATQLTAANQPKIVSAGTLIASGIKFDGIDDFLTIGGSAIPVSGTTSRSLFVKTLRRSNSNASKIIGIGDGTNDPNGQAFDFTTEFAVRVGGGNEIYLSAAPLVEEKATLIFPDGSTNVSHFEFYKDGSPVTATSVNAKAIATSNAVAYLGRSGALTPDYNNGEISTFILYASDQTANRTAIEALI